MTASPHNRMAPTMHLRRPLLALVAPLFAACAGGDSSTPSVSAPADVLYVGGDIVTMDDSLPQAEALAVAGGKIIAVGARAELEARHRGSGTKVVELAGKALLPGFLDAHSHYFSALSVANQAKVYAPPAGPGGDVEGILKAIEEFRVARQVPKGELIQAYGYDDNAMPNGRLLNRDDLDRAFPDNPVLVGHVSMHGAVLNSAALRKFGFSAATPTPPGGVIVRKPGTQEPWGLIMETAYLPVFAALPKPTTAQEVEFTKAAQRLYAEAGVTTAHEGATHAPELDVMRRAAEAGANLIDVIAYPFMTDLDTILSRHPASGWGQYRSGLKIGGVKVTIDGSPQGKTARFTSPYLTGGPGGERGWRGELIMPQPEINALVRRVYDLGVPLNLHANGDGAIDAFLTAHEAAAAGDLERDRQVTIIHAQFLRKDQIAKLARYKVRPSLYTLHTYYFYDAHLANRGKAQAQYISPMRDVIDAGIHPTNHTDFYVAPLDQLFMLWSAVNRTSRGGASVGPDQKVTPLEGLKAMTIWAAEQYGEQASKGSLVPGKRADLVILDRNPLTVAPDSIKDIRVMETVKDGRTVWAREAGTPK